VLPILRDLSLRVPGRRYLLRHWDVTGDPARSVDFNCAFFSKKKKARGASHRFGKPAYQGAEAFEPQVKDTKLVSFTQGEISDRMSYLLDTPINWVWSSVDATGAGG